MKYLVDFVHSATEEEITTYLSDNGCAVIKVWNNFDKVYLVQASTLPPKTALVEFVIEDSTVIIKPLVETNPYWGCHGDPSATSISVNINSTQDWWKNFSYVQPAFDGDLTLTRLGKGITIYLVDSGVAKDHPEFAHASIEDLFSVIENDYGDKKGHGTALASVMVGATCGITDATLKNVKIFEPNHTTLQSEMLSALDAILSDHVPNTYAICNCSWVIAKNEWVEHKFRQIMQRGIFLVTAAGNTGTSIEDVTPASMIEAITVGAYNSDLQPCDFSNYSGPSIVSLTENETNYGELDGWAPGQDIWAASLDGSYGYVSGTSIAAAITSAIVASNVYWFKTEDHTREVLYGDLQLSSDSYLTDYNVMAFSRPNLLDLSDPKYASSINRIATLRDFCLTPSSQVPDEVSGYVYVNQPLRPIRRVYMPTYTKSVEWIDPLPNNFVLSAEGMVIGAADASQGPQNGEPYKLYVCKFNRTSTDDIVETVTFNLYVLAEDTTASDIEDDVPLQIMLMDVVPCVGPVPEACEIVNLGPCMDSCTSGRVCCGDMSIKNPYECKCY